MNISLGFFGINTSTAVSHLPFTLFVQLFNLFFIFLSSLLNTAGSPWAAKTLHLLLAQLLASTDTHTHTHSSSVCVCVCVASTPSLNEGIKGII